MKIQDAILYGSKRDSGSGPTPSGSIEISENGTYNVTDKAEAVVDVEPDLTTKNISENGTYSASDDDADGYSSVTVAVPSADLTTKNITQNGTYAASGDSADGYSSVTVNVSGGADHTAEDAIIERTISGAYTNDRITTIGGGAFMLCKSVTSFSFPAVKSITGHNVFNQCTAQSYYFPELETVEASAFSSTTISAFEFPKLKTCGQLVTFNTNLQSADFPALTSIVGSAFYGCTNFTQLIIRRTDGVALLDMTNVSSQTPFNNCPIGNGFGYVYVPSALVSIYKSATNWVKISSKIRALEDYTVDGTTTGDLDPTKI